MKKRPTEKELLDGLDSQSAHADELAVLSENEWCQNPDLDNHQSEAKGHLTATAIDGRVNDEEFHWNADDQ